ncbi:MAG TPA: hypothetical protein VGC90_10860 [Candidatus Limnocylindrales bacterium]
MPSQPGRATRPTKGRKRGTVPNPADQIRAELRRLEAVRPRGTALTAIGRRESTGWHAALRGVGFGATGFGPTPHAAIANLIHLLGGGEWPERDPQR